MQAKAKMKFSDTQIKKIEELASNMSIDKVAEQFDMEEETFCETLRRQKSALRAYKKGRTIGALKSAKTLRERMEAGSTEAIIFFSKLYGVWDNEQKHEVACKVHRIPILKTIISKALNN